MEPHVFVSPAHRDELRKLGTRTHSVQDDECGEDDVGSFSGLPWTPEAVVNVDFFPLGDVGVSVCTRRVRPSKVVVKPRRVSGVLAEDDALRACRRARRRIWGALQSIKANCLLTITKRGGFATRDEAWQVTEEILKMMKGRGWIEGHVTVLELHTGERVDGGRQGANEGSFHVHVGTRRPSFFAFDEMHEAVAEIEGRVLGHFPTSPSEKMLNVNVSVKRGDHRNKRQTPASLSRYLGPYLEKALLAEDEQTRGLNRKRYDVSRGGGARPMRVQVRCNPGEIVHPAEVVVRILSKFAPSRRFSSPWSTEVGGQEVLIRSAIDWGDGEDPAVQFPETVDPEGVFALLRPRRLSGRVATSEASDSTSCEGGSVVDPVAREILTLKRFGLLRQTGSGLSRPVVGAADAGKGAGCPPPAGRPDH